MPEVDGALAVGTLVTSGTDAAGNTISVRGFVIYVVG
jgi:hypothetical protein